MNTPRRQRVNAEVGLSHQGFLLHIQFPPEDSPQTRSNVHEHSDMSAGFLGLICWQLDSAPLSRNLLFFLAIDKHAKLRDGKHATCDSQKALGKKEVAQHTPAFVG